MNAFKDYLSKEKFEIAAIIFAAGFFLYQVFDGWLYSDMKVGLSSQRASFSDSHDHVSVNIKLEKGIIGSVHLKNIIIHSDCVEKDRSIDTRKYLYNENGLITVKKDESNKEYVALSPGDTFVFSEIFQVEKNKACNFNVVVGGERAWFDKPQWFSSISSLHDHLM